MFFGHLVVGTTFHFAASFFAYFIYSILAFNWLNGASTIGGLVILAMTIRNILAQVAKVAIGQPGDSNLASGDLTILLLAAGTAAIAMAALLARHFFPVGNAVLGVEVDNGRLKTLVLAFIGIRICTSILQFVQSNAPGVLGGIGSGLLTNFSSLGMICFALGTAYHLQISGKTKSLGWANVPIMSLAVIETFLFGYKQTLIIPIMTYFLTCLAFQKKYKTGEIVAVISCALVVLPALYIYSQVVRSGLLPSQAGGAGDGTSSFMLSDFSNANYEQLLEIVDQNASLSREVGYYGQPMGILDRIAVPVYNADQVVHTAELRGDLGVEGIGGYFTILPKSLTGNSSQFSDFGDVLGQYAGIIDEENASTFIEMDPAISTYAFGGWIGVTILNFIIFGLFFAVTNVVFGSISSNPWAVAAFTSCFLTVTSSNASGGLVFVLRWVPFLLLLMYGLGKMHLVKKIPEH